VPAFDDDGAGALVVVVDTRPPAVRLVPRLVRDAAGGPELALRVVADAETPDALDVAVHVQWPETDLTPADRDLWIERAVIGREYHWGLDPRGPAPIAFHAVAVDAAGNTGADTLTFSTLVRDPAFAALARPEVVRPRSVHPVTDAGGMADALREAQDPPSASEAQDYLESIMSERFQAKLDMLEAIETSEDAEVNPAVLLPSPSVDLPPVPADDPHGFDDEPVTQKDRGKQKIKPEAPPSLPPKPEKPAPGASEAQQAEAMPPPPTVRTEKKEEKPAEDSTPPPFEPAARMRISYQKYLLPGGIAAGILIVVLIVIFAWPSGESDEPEAGELRTSAGSIADAAPEPAAAEDGGEAVGSKPDLAVMEIVTDPQGCLVYLDGMRLRGRTPLANVFIPANTEYEVVVNCKGFKKESREILARPGERLQIKIIPPPK